jgi:phosphate uptake regulator
MIQILQLQQLLQLPLFSHVEPSSDAVLSMLTQIIDRLQSMDTQMTDQFQSVDNRMISFDDRFQSLDQRF